VSHFHWHRGIEAKSKKDSLLIKDILQKRLQLFGIKNHIVKVKDNRIIIQLSKFNNNEKRILNLIGMTRKLEFRLINEKNKIEDALRGFIPEGSEIRYQFYKKNNKFIKIPHLVKKNGWVFNPLISNAKAKIDSQYNEPYILMDLNKKGNKTIKEITSKNKGKRLAIILDYRVLSTPVIREIVTEQLRITGSFSLEEAKDIAISLKSGELPCNVTIMFEGKLDDDKWMKDLL